MKDSRLKQNLGLSNFQGIIFAGFIVFAYIIAQPALISNGSKTIVEAFMPMTVTSVIYGSTIFIYLKDKNHMAIRWIVFTIIEGGYTYLVLTSSASTVTMMIFSLSLVYLFYMDKKLSYSAAILNVGLSIYSVIFRSTSNDVVSNAIIVISTLIFFIGLVSITYASNRRTSNLHDNARKMSENNLYQQQLIKEVRNVCSIVDQESNNLNYLVSSIDESSRGINSAVEEITRGATSTAEDMQKGTLLIDEIKEEIENTKRTTDNVAESSNITNEVVSNSESVVKELAEKTDEFIQRNNKVENSINHLKSKNDEILEIISVISKIAEQTNLLSLNASIEAARAGEVGKGFSVVAEEIKKLAMATKENSQEIAQILIELTNETNNSATEVKKLVEAARSQKGLVENTENAFYSIRKNINIVTDGIVDVNSKMDTIMEKSEGIHNLMNNLAAITEESMANIEEVNAMSSESIKVVGEGKEMADTLKNTVDDLGEVLN